jgi:monovalent cation:H+ antiporter-2, CPA2 family
VEAAGSEERENGRPETTSEREPETVSTGTSSVEIPAERPERPARQRDPEY